MALNLPNRYPGRFNAPTTAYPQGSFKNRTTPTAKDGSYLEQDWANDKEGFFQRLMAQAGLTANGTPDTATASQYYSALLQIIASTAPSLLDTTRIDVASATTVDLTANAPSTRNINITGTVAITAFTVAIGKLYFVRFAGALTLTNNAAIVTQRGASITTAAGDTCVLRATAANVVEILFYTPAVPQELGYGQSWQSLTASRALGSSYTNSTGRTIAVQVTANAANTVDTYGILIGSINGTAVAQNTTTSRGSVLAGSITLIVPPGATYSAAQGGGPSASTLTLVNWQELR